MCWRQPVFHEQIFTFPPKSKAANQKSAILALFAVIIIVINNGYLLSRNYFSQFWSKADINCGVIRPRIIKASAG